MKKILALILSLVMAFSFVACGNNSSSNSKNDSQKSSDSQQPSSQKESENESVETINNTNSDTLEITITPSLMYELYDGFEDELEDYKEGKLNSAVMDNIQINKDGSVTITISKHQQQKLLHEIKDELYDMFPSDDFRAIKKMEFNEDVTDVKMYVDRPAFEKGIGKLGVIGVAILAHTYHLVEAQPDKTVVIHYIDYQTNEEFDSYTSMENELSKK